MSKPERFQQRGENGFVLVATLWILAAIMLGATFFADQVDRGRALAARAQQTAKALVEVESTRSDILFRLATSDVSIAGFGPAGSPIRVDNRAYRGTGEDIVRLQDHRGLVDVNSGDREMLSRLLAQFRVPSERLDPMMDTLQDYIDVDELRRLNGAEARQYADLGLPPPANDWLTTPHQLRTIAGWRDQPGLWETPHFLQLVTTSSTGGFNPNTAPPEVLASLPGSNREIAGHLLALRGQAPLVSWAPIAELTGFGPRDLETVLWSPATSLRVTQQSRNLPWMLQFSISLTPTSVLAPWRIDYHVRSAIDTPVEDGKDVTPLPERAAQPAAPFEAF